MSQTFFLRLADIDGETQVEGHQKDIQLLSWSHSFSQPANPARSSGGGGTIEQANHADFSVTKHADIASVPMLKHCWTGKPIKSAVFSACRSDGQTLVEYLRVEMTNVIISNISVGGGSGDLPTETVTLAYGAVKYTYTPQPMGRDKRDPKWAKHDLTLQRVE